MERLTNTKYDRSWKPVLIICLKWMVVADLANLMGVCHAIRPAVRSQIADEVNHALEPWVGDVREFLRILQVRHITGNTLEANGPDHIGLRSSDYRRLRCPFAPQANRLATYGDADIDNSRSNL